MAGFIQIDNELYDRLARTKFTVAERAVIDCIVRNTIGFNRDKFPMSSTFIARYAGISDRAVRKATAKLEKMNVIVPCKTVGCSTEWRMNSPENWLTPEPEFLPYLGTGVPNTTEQAFLTPRNEHSYPIGTSVPTKKYNRNTVLNTERDTEPPTLEEVETFAKKNKLHVNPAKFFYHFQEIGWKGVKDWKARMMAWEANERNKTDVIETVEAKKEPDRWEDVG